MPAKPSIPTSMDHRLRATADQENATSSSLTRVSILQQCNSAKKRKADQYFDDVENNIFKSEDVGEENNSEVTCSKPDYIHVRARRGQATDSHSLAERARREKISKKMKCLQDLVPGCNKVIGKAGMLDEIINYVQSLQKQVEFLSMKLAAINPTLDFSIDNFFTKEIPAYLAYIPPAAAAQFDTSNSICFQYNPIQPSFRPDEALDHQSQLLPQKAAGPSSSAPIPDIFLDSSSSILHMSGWESDWTNLFNAGFQ